MIVLSLITLIVAGCSQPGAKTAVDIEHLTAFDYKDAQHIAIVVTDVDRAAKAYSNLFSIPQPKSFITESADTAKTQYDGKPTTARAKLAFFKTENMSFELIEPIGGPSAWKDGLDKNGPSAHHVAYNVKDIDKQIQILQANGYKLLHQGQWTDGNGGRYAYIDTTEHLGMMIELLEGY